MSFKWLNEPKKWSGDSSAITVHTDGKTDFWSKTFYGVERDNGHFYYRSLSGGQNFTATVDVKGNYQALYDQSGLMIRIDDKNWIKFGAAYVDGNQFASVVVTVNGWSDWSFFPLSSQGVLRLRLKREKEAVQMEYGEGENSEYKMTRLAYFPVLEKSQEIMVGIMCASPGDETQGFDLEFRGLNIVENQAN